MTALVLLALMYTLASGGSMTAATDLGRDAQRWSNVELPAEVVAVADDIATRTGDAGPTYEALLRSIESNPDRRRTLERYVSRRQTGAEPADELLEPAFERLVRAAEVGSASIFADEPGQLITFDRDVPELDRLYDVGRAATRHAAALATTGEGERARQLYEAALVLGVRLADERIVHRQWQVGTRLIGDALGGLTALAARDGDAERATRLRSAGNALGAYVRDTTGPIWDVIGTTNNAVETDSRAETHFGDVAMIARSDEAGRDVACGGGAEVGQVPLRCHPQRRPPRGGPDRVAAGRGARVRPGEGGGGGVAGSDARTVPHRAVIGSVT